MNPRSVTLLLLAVLLPALALAVLGFVLLGQQQEVVRLRQQDRDLLTTRIAGDSLSARLTRAADATVADAHKRPHHLYPGSDSLLNLGSVQEGRWVAPYARTRSSSLSDPAFQSWLTRHGQLERRGASTSELLRSLARTPADSTQRAYLQFLRGRTLLERGDSTAATDALEPLLALGMDVADEYGVPLSLYAADALGTDAPRSGEWLNPLARAFEQDLDSLGYRSEYELLATITPAAAQLDGWRVFNAEWLVGSHQGRIIGAPISRLRYWVPEADSIATAGGSGLLTLAPVFPELSLRLRPPTEAPGVSGLWTLTLALTVFLSMMAAVLLLRDHRREKHLSALRSKFVSSVSHEVRTPLSAIRLYTEALLSYGRGEDEAVWRADLGTIAKETGRLTRMLDNVLTFSRVERGVQKYTLKEGRLDRVLENTSRVMRPALEEVGCTFMTELDPVETMLDSDGIQQAVVNLLANAVRYAPDSRVVLRCREEEGNAVIEVTDEGPGLATEEVTRVFEPFYRAGNGANTGTGLGLSIVQHVAIAHGGLAAVSSEPGNGCRFTISFPIAP